MTECAYVCVGGTTLLGFASLDVFSLVTFPCRELAAHFATALTCVHSHYTDAHSHF